MKFKNIFYLIIVTMCFNLLSCSGISQENDSDILDQYLADETDYNTIDVYISTSIPNPDIPVINFEKLSITEREKPTYEIISIETFDNSFWNNVWECKLPDSFIIEINDTSLSVISDTSEVTEEPYYITGVQYNSNYWELPERVPLHEVAFHYVKTSDALMIGYSDYGEIGWHSRYAWYYINSTGVWSMVNTPLDDRVEYSFYEKDDNIVYSKLNSDYILAMQSIFDMIKVYTDDNQYVIEYGILNMNSDNLEYNWTKYCTIYDYIMELSESIYLREYTKKYSFSSIGELYDKILAEWEAERNADS